MICLLLAVTLLGASINSSNTDRYTQIYTQSIQKIKNNINPPNSPLGTLLASPSTSSPDYYYHWVRDASLVYQSFVDDEANVDQLLVDYGILSQRHQSLSPQGGLGEPKFMVGGSTFDGPWGRPQNDGPALRALTLITFIERFLTSGGDPYRVTWLYKNDFPATSVVKKDLEYVASNWKNSCFDLWEEVNDTHFYTRMVQQAAMDAGSRIALMFNDPAASAYYTAVKIQMQGAMDQFWDAGRNRLKTYLGNDDRLDTALILGCLHSHSDANWKSYRCSSERILASSEKLVAMFKIEYPINAGREIPLLGRYNNDVYDGVSTSQGNPWILCTFAFAEMLYKAAIDFAAGSKVEVTSVSSDFYKNVLGLNLDPQSIPSSQCTFDYVIGNMTAKADLFLDRALEYTQAGGYSFPEEINRSSGALQGARDLTWSYASFVTAFQARRKAMVIPRNPQC